MRNSVLLLLLSLAAFAQSPSKPQRTVNGHTLVSRSDPAVKLNFSKSFTYAGGQVIDIFHVAEAEQHFFVEAAPDKSIKRFYWIQFEHYYPSNGHTYDYSGIKSSPLMIGSIEFVADTRVSQNYFNADTRSGSDSEAGRKLLEQKGYKLDGSFARVRMFYLPDSTKTKELMVIYGEALTPGVGDEQAKYQAVEHAREGLKIE
jgi:hypothetical protein